MWCTVINKSYRTLKEFSERIFFCNDQIQVCLRFLAKSQNYFRISFWWSIFCVKDCTTSDRWSTIMKNVLNSIETTNTMQSQIDMVEQMKTRHDMPLFRGQSSRKIIPIMFLLDIVEKRRTELRGHAQKRVKIRPEV